MTAKDLKNALLQEAVQGKLVPQIASEGNARDLLEEIRKSRGESDVLFSDKSKSKTKLVSEASLPLTTARKRSSATPSAGTPRNAPMEITEDEIPFDIPESWCWVRWGELSDSIQYGYNASAQEKGKIRMVRISDIQENKVLWDTVPYCEIEDEEIPTYLLKENDILFARTGGTVGKSFLVKNIPCDAIYAGYLIRTHYNSEKLVPEYLKFFMESELYWSQLRNGTIATAQPNCNGQTLSKMLVPLPPLAEQKRIVAAIEKFMPLIEEYGKKETVLNELNAQIGTLTKKAILQEAVQGKLVPQIASEGNARDLLEEIRKSHTDLQIPTESAGKKKGDLRSKSQIRVTKKEKNLPEITDDEIPFDIPESWCWCRLGEITSILGDGIHGTPEYDVSGDYYFVNGNNLLNGKIVIKPDTKKVNQKEYDKYKKQLNENTVFVSINGTLGNLAFYNNEKIILGKSACYFNLIKNEMKQFIYHFMQTKYFFDYAEAEATKTTIRNVSLGAMRSLLVPLPPLAEQKRIVAAIERLLPLCEKLGK